MGENIFVLSMLLYSMPYTIARSKSLQNLLKYGKHPQVLRITKPSIRMSDKNVNFGDKKVKESNFYESKKVFKIDDINVNKTLVSEKESYKANKSN